MQPFHELGQRYATELRPGNVNVSGTIGRAHINGALLKLMLGERRRRQPARRARSSARRSTSACGWRTPASPGNSSTVTVHGVKLDGWSYAMPEDDFVLEQVSSRRSGSASRTPERRPTVAALPPKSCCSAADATARRRRPAGRPRAAARRRRRRAERPSCSAPLVLADVQRIQRAARDERALTSVLMVQQALVEPRLTVEQVNQHARRPGRVPARRGQPDQRPAARRRRAASEPSRPRWPAPASCSPGEFGWTPERVRRADGRARCSLYLEMLGRGEPARMTSGRRIAAPQRAIRPARRRRRQRAERLEPRWRRRRCSTIRSRR